MKLCAKSDVIAPDPFKLQTRIISGRMTLPIKNMVCPRCIRAVRQILEQAGLDVKSVRLGAAEIEGELTREEKSRLAAQLETLGFELLEDRKSRTIEQVKNTIVELVRSERGVPDANLSDYLSERLGLDYKYLSSLFSEMQGRTIEKFFIAQKIERVKELLVYDELTLGEIAFRLGYSSTAHLSAQFKRTTGLTPSFYKRMGDKKRRSLDEL